MVSAQFNTSDLIAVAVVTSPINTPTVAQPAAHNIPINLVALDSHRTPNTVKAADATSNNAANLMLPTKSDATR